MRGHENKEGAEEEKVKLMVKRCRGSGNDVWGKTKDNESPPRPQNCHYPQGAPVRLM